MSPNPESAEGVPPREPFAAGWTGMLTIAAIAYIVIALGTMFVSSSESLPEIFTLFSDSPASIIAAVLAAIAARKAGDPAARRAWRFLAASIAVYSVGNLLNSTYWLFGVDPKVVRAAGLNCAGRESPEGRILLVLALVDVAAFIVGVDLLRPRNDLSRRVHIGHRVGIAEFLGLRRRRGSQLLGRRLPRLIDPDARADNRLGHLQICRQNLRLPAAVFNAIPVIRRLPSRGVVVILQLVRTADNTQNLIVITCGKGQRDRLLRRIVRLCLKNDVTASQL
jgi:hypothetical protein